MRDVEGVFEDYREAVALVAAPAEERARWMDSTGYSSDELRCQLDDVEIFEDRLKTSRMLSEDAVLAVRALLTHMDSMTEHDLWADDRVLASRAEWAHARRLASEALRVIDLARQDADVSNDVRWVERISRMD